jgi:phage tail sheath protein FI
MRSEPTVPGLYFSVTPPPAAPSPLRSDVAGFIGRTRRGPVGVPIRVEGWRGYQREFGGLARDVVMTYAIRGYFDNEGEVAHVIRLCHQSATPATAEWKIGELDKQGQWTASSPAGFEYASYRIEATSPGAWANNTRIAITYRRRGASGGPELDVTVGVPDEPVQYFTGLSLASELAADNENPANTFEEFVASGSRFIRLVPLGPKATRRLPTEGPHLKEWERELTLRDGQDSAAGETPGKQSYLDALTMLGDVGEVALVAVPGLFDDIPDDPDDPDAEQNEVLVALVEQAEQLRDRLVLIDVRTDREHQGEADQALREVEKTLDWIEGLRRNADDKAARAAAVYHPRLTILDPLGGLRHPLREVPPSGHVAGVISRLDRQRGAHYTPANAEIFGAVDVTQSFDPLEQARLNLTGVNLLRCFAGKGLLVWGGRTLHLDPERRFLVYRRLIHRLVRAIRRVAEPLVFETNGPELWLALARSITTILLEAWRAGALKGARQEEAFRVRCNAENNPPDEIDLGRVLCEIDVAPAAPMEFIELRLSFSGQGKLEVFET